MGSQVSRLGDKGNGVCSCHDSPKNAVGTIINGSANVIINGKPCAMLSDKLVAPCGHIGMIINGASKTLTNGKPTAYLGSNFSGCFTGTIINGSPNVLAG